MFLKTLQIHGHEKVNNENPFQNLNPYQGNVQSGFVVDAAEEARASFIRRTYAHLAAAIFAFVAIEAVIFSVVPSETLFSIVSRMGGFGWLIVLGVYMGVSWMARSWASSDTSKGMQYLGLGMYILAEVVIFLPLLFISSTYDPMIPAAAGAITLMAFGGLTLFVFMTRVDLAPIGKYLALAGIVAMGAIIVGILFDISMFGLLFSGLMVALACGYIMYDTSNIIHHYRTDQHVAASLALFASVALLFYYVLRIALMFASND